LIFKRRVT